MFEFPIKEVERVEAKENLRKLILNNGLKWAEGVDRVGKRVKWIFDLREVIATPEGSRLATLLLFDKLRNFKFDYVGGPTFAAEPIVASLVTHSYLIKQPIEGFIVRDRANNYGLGKLVEGPLISGKNVVLVDDAINSGYSILKAIDILNSLNLNVVGLVVILDFYKSGHKKLLKNNVKVDSIFNLDDFGLNCERTIEYRNTLSYYNVDNNQNNDKKSISNQFQEFNDYLEVDGKILKINNEGYFSCVDKTNNSNLWKTKIGAEVTTLAFDEETNLVIVSIYSGLKKGILGFFDITTGKMIKRINIEGAIHTKPSFFSNFLFLGSDDKNLYCINRYTQNVLWSYKTGDKIRGDVVIDKVIQRVYFGSFDGFVYSVNFEGKLVWKRHVGNNVTNALQMHMFSIFVLSDINVLFRLDKTNGNLLWFFAPKNKIKNFSVHKNEVIVWCNNGFLYLLNLHKRKTEIARKLNDEINEIIVKNDFILIRCDNGDYTLEV